MLQTTGCPQLGQGHRLRLRTGRQGVQGARRSSRARRRLGRIQGGHRPLPRAEILRGHTGQPRRDQSVGARFQGSRHLPGRPHQGTRQGRGQEDGRGHSGA
ncbi:MAG: hypothetical protein MZU79_07180 [Anaerotruncus sp.]|nr:hypothetical protein [Anaerotruncus sp.]